MLLLQVSLCCYSKKIGKCGMFIFITLGARVINMNIPCFPVFQVSNRGFTLVVMATKFPRHKGM